MAGSIKVFTNGTFQVGEGKIRNLEAGQILRGDGILLNPDGTLVTVFDHIAMDKGRVLVFKDGVAEPLTSALTLPDGTSISSDGSYSRPTGRRARLVDGQLLTPEGAPMPTLDSITLRDGKVTVFKSGALIALQSPVQIIGMYDSSRVRADGLITRKDGSTYQLKEGETITVEGVRASW